MGGMNYFQLVPILFLIFVSLINSLYLYLLTSPITVSHHRYFRELIFSGGKSKLMLGIECPLAQQIPKELQHRLNLP